MARFCWERKQRRKPYKDVSGFRCPENPENVWHERHPTDEPDFRQLHASPHRLQTRISHSDRTSKHEELLRSAGQGPSESPYGRRKALSDTWVRWGSGV